MKTIFSVFMTLSLLAVTACYDVPAEGSRDAGTARDTGVPQRDGGHDGGASDAAYTDDTGAGDTGDGDAVAADGGGSADVFDGGTGDAEIPDAGAADAGAGDGGVDPCENHCLNGVIDCGETGLNCGGGGCDACGDPCDRHCSNGKADCGETGRDCGGECSACGSGGCSFPQGVPEGDFFSGSETDGAIAGAVNAVMTNLSDCNVGSDCPIGDRYPDGQPWFVDVAQALRDQGYCAGQHELGYTDEIAVSNTGCTGRWFGYHIYNYGGQKVVWNPGAQRGWWSINPVWCTGR